MELNIIRRRSRLFCCSVDRLLRVVFLVQRLIWVFHASLFDAVSHVKSHGVRELEV